MPTNKLKFNDLPRALQRQLEWDVKFIKEFNETILRLRSLELRFGDRGRYEAEWRENNDSIVEQLQKATDKIKSFCSKLKKKAINVKMYLMNFLTKNQWIFPKIH